MGRPRISTLVLGLLALIVATEIPAQNADLATAPVTIDGEVLFHVRGLTAYPAKKRAADIRERIVELAASSTPMPPSA